MRNARFFVFAALAIALATSLFYLVEHQISSTLLEASLRPEVREALEASMKDQKQLRALDPQNAASYKKRFDGMHTLAARIDVLRLSRAEILRRYEIVLAAVVAIVLVLTLLAGWLRRRREERRLAGIQHGLEALSRGETRVVLGDSRRDLLGRIATMIEQTATLVSGQRKRIESLQHLSSWQEAARRHAHEIRTPVTAARLEVERLASLAGSDANIEAAKESALEELDRLARYTTEFSSFAKLPQPVLRAENISEVVEEFCRAFATAWPNLTLGVRASRPPQPGVPRPAASEEAIVRGTVDRGGRERPHSPLALVDRDMLRQVFANLCANSSLAVNGGGSVTFSVGHDDGRVFVDIADNGRGIDPSILPRLFQPYTTTRRIGEGMGLGLAICRKIMLDHDGDLELVESSAAGTTFRLTLRTAGEHI